MQKIFLITLFLFSFSVQNGYSQDTASINKSWSYVKNKFNIQAQGVGNLSKILADSTSEDKEQLKKISNEAVAFNKFLASFSQVTKPQLDETKKMLTHLESSHTALEVLFDKYPKLKNRRKVQEQIALLTGNSNTLTFVLHGYNDVCRENKRLDLLFSK